MPIENPQSDAWWDFIYSSIALVRAYQKTYKEPEEGKKDDQEQGQQPIIEKPPLTTVNVINDKL